MALKAAARLNELGQSAWLDLIGRKLIHGGELARLVREDGIRGVTANPSIFEKAIVESSEYDDELISQSKAGTSPLAIYEALAVADVRAACDVLLPLFAGGGAGSTQDGFVSLEVSPALALDTTGTLTEAKRFWAAVDRPNLFIKIPATPEGIPAIRQVTAAGISVNITLIFSNTVYAQVIEAYLAGLEERVARGLPVGGIHSVASFFVSRVDTAVDKLLEQKGTPQAKSLQGKIAVANAKEAYQLYRRTVESERWRRLEAKGAHRQRPLWASTGTKNKAYSDVLYVEELIGPETVNTLPLATLQAFNDHGKVARTIDLGLDEARAQLAALASAGIDLEQVCAQLTRDGVKLFSDALAGLLRAIAARSEAIRAFDRDRREESLGRRRPEAEQALAKAKELKLAQKLFARDPGVFGDAVTSQAGFLDIADRMRRDAPELRAFAREAAQRFTHALVVAEGHAAIAADFYLRSLGPQPGGLQVRLLESTCPESVRAALDGLDAAKTLFVLSDRSDAGIGFEALMEQVSPLAPPTHFVAVTSEGAALERRARERGYGRVFLDPAGLHPSHAVLGYAGLLPAALLGVDPGKVIDAISLAALSSEGAVPPRENLALRIGAISGGLAALPDNAADKLTLILSPSLQPLGPWVEQAVAAATGKGGTGVVVIDGEPAGAPSDYGADRLFISLRLAGESSESEGRVRKLVSAGFPVLRWQVTSREALAGECARFAIAAAEMAPLLGVHPLDAPAEPPALAKARALLEAGTLADEPALRSDGVALFGSAPYATVLRKAAGTLGAKAAGSPAHWLAAHLALAGPGDFIALRAFLPDDAATWSHLRALRTLLRDRLALPATTALGPRGVHTTGALLQGGRGNVTVIQLTRPSTSDLPVPGKPWTFGALFAAQARGELETLLEAGRRALRIDVEDGDLARLPRLFEGALQALGK